jgi:Concanavalin A-like lectin/glucanases superfamily
VTAVDPDTDSLSYSLVARPPGMTIDANSGRITWSVPPLPTGIVSLWDAETTARDSLGKHHGALRDEVTFAHGATGDAFSFQGGYVEVPDSSALETADAHTVDAWVRTTSTSSVGGAIATKYQTDTAEDGWSLLVLPDGRVNAIVKNSSGVGHLLSSTLRVNHGEFHHLAMTWNTSNGTLRLFIDGELDIESGPLTGSFVGNTRPVLIGARHHSSGAIEDSRFSGLVDEVAFFNRALTTEEVRLRASRPFVTV